MLAAGAAIGRPCQGPRLLRGAEPGGLRPGPAHHRRDLRCLLAGALQPAGRVCPGHHPAGAGAGGRLGRVRERARIHLPSAPGRQVPLDLLLHAEPRPQRRRRRVQPEAADGPQGSLLRLCRRHLALFRRHGDAGADQFDQQGRRPDGADQADAPGPGDPRRPRHGLRLDPFGGIRRRAAQGEEAARPRPAADRHRAVPVRRLSARRAHQLPGQSGLLARQAGDRPPVLPDQPRSARARQDDDRGQVPGDGRSDARHRRQAEGRSGHRRHADPGDRRRLSRLQHHSRSRSTTSACARR